MLGSSQEAFSASYTSLYIVWLSKVQDIYNANTFMCVVYTNTEPDYHTLYLSQIISKFRTVDIFIFAIV
jgi:hypothetical protein